MRAVERFNLTTNTWTEFADSSSSSKVPIDIYGSGCIVLPNEEILILGANLPNNNRSNALFNVESNSWKLLEDVKRDRSFTSLANIGNRTFAFGGGTSNTVEEFIYSNESWVPVEFKLHYTHSTHSTISVPAELFSHLPGGCEGVI